jgi:hypothetical protein
MQTNCQCFFTFPARASPDVSFPVIQSLGMVEAVVFWPCELHDPAYNPLSMTMAVAMIGSITVESHTVGRPSLETLEKTFQKA